jgi:hypothetical protein
MKRKLRLPFNYPCVCGHSKKIHKDVYVGSLWEEWCNGEGKQGKYYSYTCECEKFTPDNLKYLEQESNKKKRGK